MGRLKRTPTQSEMEALAEALAIMGGYRAVATAIGNLSKTAIQRWSVSGVPAERCADLERLTGIPRWRLRPDLYKTPLNIGLVIELEASDVS